MKHDGPRDERALLRRIGGGDREAARLLVERSYRSVWSSLLRMSGDADEAAALTGETYRKAWQALGSFDGRASLSTWLYRIAYTTFLSSRRQPYAFVPLDATVRGSGPAPPADVELDSRQSNDRVRLAVLQLPDELRFIVTAHHWARVSTSELARATGTSVAAITERLCEAQKRLSRAVANGDDDRENQRVATLLTEEKAGEPPAELLPRLQAEVPARVTAGDPDRYRDSRYFDRPSGWLLLASLVMMFLFAFILMRVVVVELRGKPQTGERARVNVNPVPVDLVDVVDGVDEVDWIGEVHAGEFPLAIEVGR